MAVTTEILLEEGQFNLPHADLYQSNLAFHKKHVK